METLKYFLIGLGLAMDAFAVSVSSGVTIKNMRIRHALQIGLFFGVFQAIMPVIGWLMGNYAREYIANYDHWIAFGLLSAVGLKMIYEAIVIKESEKESDPLNISVLFILAIATSLDALAVGVTFSLLDIQILTPVIIIGVTTFVLSFSGTYIGKSFGHRFDEAKLEVAGGIILIGIGVKILLEHLL